MASRQTGGPVKTAVITGGHDFDVIAFHEMFRGMPEIDAYLQNMEDFVTDSGNNRDVYDALLFYNMHKTTPGPGQGDYGVRMKEALEALGVTQQGIVVLHHGIVAFPDWQLWGDLCGLPVRSSVGGAANQTVRLEIADPGHPVTSGMAPWEITDETYSAGDADDASHVLLRTGHPDSMKTIAWTREYGKARVFSFQSGHDKTTFTDPGYRTILSRGLQWVARRI